MGIIERSLIIEGRRKKRVVAFFDSGSSFSIVNKKIINEIGSHNIEDTDIKIELGDGSNITFKKRALITIIMNKNSYTDYYLVGDIPEQLIIGVNFLQKYGHTLEFKNDTIISKNMKLKNKRGKYVL